LTSLALFRRLLSHSFRYWKGFALALVGMVITAATETALPALMKQLIDKGFVKGSQFPLLWVPAILLGIFLSRGVAMFLASYSMSWVANNTLRDIRQAMFRKLISMPSAEFDKRSAGQLISRIINEAQQVLFAAADVVTVLVKESLILIGLFGWLFWMNWKLTLALVAVVPFLALITLKSSKRMRAVSKSNLLSAREMTASVEEVISGNRVIKVYGGEAYEKKRFDTINAKYRSQAMRYAVASALQGPLGQIIAALGVAVIITLALSQARSGLLTVGDFVSFITAMFLMFAPLKSLMQVNAKIQKGLAAAEGVFELMDEQTEKDAGSREIARAHGEIVFEQVAIQYPTRDVPALNGFSLHVVAGKTYALVGPSGSGKTTVVNLLPRLYEIDSGKIMIDGIDIRDLRLSSLREQIALVSQDVVLFNDTIARNIAYGREDLSDAQIQKAAEAADLTSFIDSLPQGLETVVGDRGVRVSGGQRQRIAIARAILKDAPILILDEATSALDTRSEANVQQAIERLRQGRTTIVIAHRLSTVVNADKIVVLDRGRIVQAGTHEALVREPGLYQSLYSSLH
jgi:ATP-binding cassette, subfamily B, bacterial MsbA